MSDRTPGGVAAYEFKSQRVGTDSGVATSPACLLATLRPVAGEVLACFYQRTLDLEDSADLVAETFAVAYKRRGRFRDVGKPGAAWLFGIARNELRTYRRRRRAVLRAVERLGVQVPLLDDESIDRIEAIVDMEAYPITLRVALRQLSSKEQNALRLRVLEDMEYRSVATALGCSDGAARVRVQRGLSRPAEILEAAARRRSDRRPAEYRL